MVPIVKGGEGGGEEGSGVTKKVQREDWRMSDKPLRNSSTQNDYVASRVQVHLYRTQIKKKMYNNKNKRSKNARNQTHSTIITLSQCPFHGNLDKHEGWGGGGVRVGGSRVSDYAQDQQNWNPLYIYT